jgi:hypothetical protein
LRIEPLTSRFPHRDLKLDFFARKFQIKEHEYCETVNNDYAYHYILLGIVKILISIIEGILMMVKSNIPKNESKEEIPKIKPAISRFPFSEIDLDFFSREFQLNNINNAKRYKMLMHTITSY